MATNITETSIRSVVDGVLWMEKRVNTQTRDRLIIENEEGPEDLTGYIITMRIREIDLDAGVLPESGYLHRESGEEWNLTIDNKYIQRTTEEVGGLDIVIPLGLGMTTDGPDYTPRGDTVPTGIPLTGGPKYYEFGILIDDGGETFNKTSRQIVGIIPLVYGVA